MNSSENLDILANEIFDTTPLPRRVSFEECLEMACNIQEIRELKKAKDVAIFAHSYVNSEILRFVSDVTGDSLHLANEAKNRPEKNFVFAAVKFMAETAKIINPLKSVYLSATDGGCTLASSITVEEIQTLRARYPQSTFVCYVNTTAEVKALCDVSVTSTNALRVILNIPNNEIFFLPDRFMGENLSVALKASGSTKTFRYSEGACVVHEQFSPQDIAYWRDKEPGVLVLAHPECPPSVIAKSDFVGSTSQIANVINTSDRKVFLALTECGLASHLQSLGLGEKRIVGSCSICPYMKSNSLKGLVATLTNLDASNEVVIPTAIREAALGSLQKMWELDRESTATAQVAGKGGSWV